MEVWKTISNYEDYKVSDLGRVKSLKYKKERILKNQSDKDGYLMVTLCNGKPKQIKVHQLVAMMFLNHTPCGMDIQVDHISKNITDNRPINLQLLTPRDHNKKDFHRGKSKYIGVSWSSNDKKWRSRIYINGSRKHLGLFKTEIEAHLAYQSALKSIE